MDEFQVRDQRVGHVLEEDRGAVYEVEGCAVTVYRQVSSGRVREGCE